MNNNYTSEEYAISLKEGSTSDHAILPRNPSYSYIRKNRHYRQISEDVKQLPHNQVDQNTSAIYQTYRHASLGETKKLLSTIKNTNNNKKLQTIIARLNDKTTAFRQPSYIKKSMKHLHDNFGSKQQLQYNTFDNKSSQSIIGDSVTPQLQNNIFRNQSQIDSQNLREVNVKSKSRLKELFQVKAIEIKNKFDLFDEMKKRAENSQQIKIIDMEGQSSQFKLKSPKRFENKLSNPIFNVSQISLVQDSSTQKLEALNFNNFYTESISQKLTQVPSTSRILFDTASVSNIPLNKFQDYSYKYIEFDNLPSKRSLSTMKSKGPQLYNKYTIDLKANQNLMMINIPKTIASNNKNQIYQMDYESINDQDYGSPQIQDHDNSFENSQITLRKQHQKKNFTMDKKRYQELKKEQQRIQDLMRNNYFYNNYALSGAQNPSYSKLKTRFPLFDMVVQDDDFMEGLRRRRHDVFGLQDSLVRNIYNDKVIPQQNNRRDLKFKKKP